MEDKLHELIREAYGGVWNIKAKAIWDEHQRLLSDATRILEDANNGWQNQPGGKSKLTG